MSHRIAHLISVRHVAPSSVLGLSFTNKAAAELKERVKSLLSPGFSKRGGSSATKGLVISTFHSLCVRILRTHAHRLGFTRDFTILDTSDQLDVLRQILRHIRLDDRKFDPDAILFRIGQAKQHFLDPEQSENFFLSTRRENEPPSDYALATASAYPRYQEQLKTLNAMDFDDLLFHTVRLLECFEDVREHYNYLFRYILVDEYQDTNLSQFRLLKLLTQRNQNICVVGDDDQSIYAWRGADPTHILEFGKHFPGAQMITLDQNYRSTTRILEAANKVISGNRVRHPKKLWSDRGEGEAIQQVVVEDDRAESEMVADEIAKLERPWSDVAILYRSNAQSRLFEEALRMRKIPYKIVGGMSFLERKEVKDILSYWRLIVNPDDEPSARRVINWPPRGIGKTAIQNIGTIAVQKGISFFRALETPDELPTRGRESVAKFRSLILDLRQELEQIPVDRELLSSWAKRSLDKIGAKLGIEQDHDDPVQAAQKYENVEELANSLGQLSLEGIQVDGVDVEAGSMNSMAVLREFLSRLALDAKEDEEKDEETGNQVTLLTLHGAKGLEYPIVFLVGFEEGFLPHKRTIEEAKDFSEERRLCYVGITRARDQLWITRARTRIRYGKPLPRLASRFLAEIHAELILTRDESAGPDLSSKEAVEKHEAKVSDFLAKIRGRLESSPG